MKGLNNMNSINYVIFDNIMTIYNVTSDGFMSYEPPCYKCLVKTMCIEDIISTSYHPNISINVCEKLNKFIKEDQIFNNLREYRGFIK